MEGPRLALAGVIISEQMITDCDWLDDGANVRASMVHHGDVEFFRYYSRTYDEHG